MFVVKRNGSQEPVQFDKITQRISNLCDGLSSQVNPTLVTQKVCSGLYDGVSTMALDHLAAETAAQLTMDHPDYAILAARIEVSNLHKLTSPSFTKTIQLLHKAGTLRNDYCMFIYDHTKRLDDAIVYERDFDFDYFGFKTLERAYLLKYKGVIMERPQHMFMRVACEIHHGNIQKVIQTYDMLSTGCYIHATPTLFNSGLHRPQMASCFLMTAKEDSISGIFDTIKQCATISKHAGGIGLSISNIRASNSPIMGTNGTSNGIVPMLRVFNSTARYVDQGGGKRAGSFAIYLEPHHPDIMEFLDLRKNNGAEELRCRDLFLGLWISDLFMERVRDDQPWTLFSPDQYPGLQDAYGEQYSKLYRSYERKDDKTQMRVPARKIWNAILTSQQETGTPYIMFKNACNSKSNQNNLGTIRSSNFVYGNHSIFRSG